MADQVGHDDYVIPGLPRNLYKYTIFLKNFTETLASSGEMTNFATV